MENDGNQEELEAARLSLTFNFEGRQYNITARYWHVRVAVTILFNPEKQYVMINRPCNT